MTDLECHRKDCFSGQNGHQRGVAKNRAKGSVGVSAFWGAGRMGGSLTWSRCRTQNAVSDILKKVGGYYPEEAYGF